MFGSAQLGAQHEGCYRCSIRIRIEESMKSLPTSNAAPLARHRAATSILLDTSSLPLAALLVKLSRDSAEATARIERLSRNLFATVLALLIVTLVLFAKEANDLYEKSYRNQAASFSEQMMRHLVSDSTASRE
jgi:hypothetical protein